MKSFALILILLIVSALYNYSFSQGLTCQTATAISTGTHTANNSLGDQWYSFTNGTSETMIMEASSCGFTSGDTYFSVTRTCGSLGYAANDDACTSQSKAEFLVEPAETVYINWGDNYTTSIYQWQLSSIPVEDGDLCTKPKSILAGLNISNKPGEEQWYTYTNNTGQEKVISFIGESTNYVTLYSNCATPITGGYLRQDYLIAAGETILVSWNNVEEWNFEIRNPGVGDKCQLAQTAIIGTNIPAHYRDVQWFTYTNNSAVEKVVETSNDEVNAVYVYGDCNSSIPLTWSFERVSYITAPGQTLYFLVGYAQEFNLNVRDVAAGDYCSNPIVGHEGLNFNNHFGLDLWYAYTNSSAVTQDIRVATNESSFIRVYTGCNTSSLQNPSYHFEHTLAPNETVYFLMKNVEEYSIDIGNELIGDLCSNPIQAQYGINYPSKVQEDQWFQYTNNTGQTAYIKIDNNGTFINPTPNSFAVLASCSDPIPNLGRAYAGIVTLPPGNSFLIHWFNVNSWTMSEHVPAPGEYCHLAKNLQLGINQANNINGSQWYTYKNETAASQSLEVSSCGLTTEDTRVYIYGSCSGTSIDEDDDFCDSQSKLTYTIQPDETIYILWSDSYTSGSYSWRFSIDGVTSIQNASDAFAFNVFPTSSEGTYHFSEPVKSVDVYTVMGNLIKSKTKVSSVDLSEYAQGIYILKIEVGDGIRSYRVMKQ